MKKNEKHILLPDMSVKSPRRTFLKNGAMIGAISGLTGMSLVAGCKDDEGEEVTPAEDLMREHGVLNRIMLVYDDCRSKLTGGLQFPVEVLYNSAQMIRSFVEDYHEQLEEKYIFPRFINSNKLVDLVQLLFVQHHAGRILTDQILKLAVAGTLKSPEDTGKLVNLLVSFNRMYRPHEAREDTVLFPALKSIVSRHEYSAMGEDFEKKENELFGADGFESMVNKIADLEKQIGIYDMSVYTPSV